MDYGYCAENGFYCPFLDPASGLCIATTCKQGIDFIIQADHEQIEFNKMWNQKEEEK